MGDRNFGSGDALGDNAFAVSRFRITAKVRFGDLAQRQIRFALDRELRCSLVEIICDSYQIAFAYRIVSIGKQQIAVTFPAVGIAVLFEVAVQVVDKFSALADLVFDLNASLRRQFGDAFPLFDLFWRFVVHCC